MRNRRLIDYNQEGALSGYSIMRDPATEGGIRVTDYNRETPLVSQVILGDSLKVLRNIPDNTFRTCITSPPYWGLRDYAISGQIGAEDRLDDYIENLVSIFREVRRTLTPNGTLWLNIGDSYTSGNRRTRDPDKKNLARGMSYRPPTPEGLKPKDLIGLPWRLAFALQADGWFLRSDIIWHKPNCQPESVKDRPTRCHEYLFLFAKSEKYYFNSEEIREPSTSRKGWRNRRSIWSINTEPNQYDHVAMFPESLIEPCIHAGTIECDTVLDPFFGSGTVGVVALKLHRRFCGIELNPKYLDISYKRISELVRS